MLASLRSHSIRFGNASLKYSITTIKEADLESHCPLWHVMLSWVSFLVFIHSPYVRFLANCLCLFLFAGPYWDSLSELQLPQLRTQQPRLSHNFPKRPCRPHTINNVEEGTSIRGQYDNAQCYTTVVSATPCHRNPVSLLGKDTMMMSLTMAAGVCRDLWGCTGIYLSQPLATRDSWATHLVRGDIGKDDQWNSTLPFCRRPQGGLRNKNYNDNNGMNVFGTILISSSS